MVSGQFRFLIKLLPPPAKVSPAPFKPYRSNVELNSTALSAVPGPISSTNLVAVLEFWRLGIFWNINLDQTVGIHKNNLDRKGLNEVRSPLQLLSTLGKTKVSLASEVTRTQIPGFLSCSLVTVQTELYEYLRLVAYVRPSKTPRHLGECRYRLKYS